MKRTTGQLVRIGSGEEAFQAFVPAPFPPEPPLELTAADQALLERANRALGKLDGMTSLLPNTSLFVYAYVRKERARSAAARKFMPRQRARNAGRLTAAFRFAAQVLRSTTYLSVSPWQATRKVIWSVASGTSSIIDATGFLHTAQMGRGPSTVSTLLLRTLARRREVRRAP